MYRSKDSIWYRLVKPLLNNRGEVGNQGGSGDLEQLLKQVKELTSNQEKLDKANKDMQRKLDEAERELLSPEYLEYLDGCSRGGKGNKGDDDDDDDKGKNKGDVDFEAMSKKELIEHIQGATRKELQDIKDGLEESVGKLSKSIGSALAQVDLSMALRDNKDFKFDEHKETFFAKAKENPGWSATRVLKEVKRDLKDASDEEQRKKDEEAKEERKALTERIGAPDSTMQDTELSDDEAASLAYDQSFGPQK